MPAILPSLKRAAVRDTEPPLRLVVGLNRVDEIVHEGWNTRINLPTRAAASEIQRKCQNVVGLLSKATKISSSQIEYYSAIKRYRLHELLGQMIRHCYAGFKLADVEPLAFEDLEGVDPEARQFAKEEWRRRIGRRRPEISSGDKDRLFAELSRVLGAEDLQRIGEELAVELREPPRIAVLGQAGVGKTTTVNALFATEWRTSAVEVGTRAVNSKSVRLPSGGQINVFDLPGYGRSIADDARYEQIYRDTIPSCDLILLIIQADRGDLADDLEMITRIRDWIREAPNRHRTRQAPGGGSQHTIPSDKTMGEGS